MAYNKINWENGTIRQEGYVTIDGVQYQTVQPEYEGNTPINADNLDHMDEGIKKANDKNIMSLGLSVNTDISISRVNFAFNVPLDTVKASIGEKLSYNSTNKSIVIGEGVSYIKVSGYCLSRGIINTARTFIQKNGFDLMVGYTYQQTTGQWGTCSFSPELVAVNEGDEFTLGVGAGATGTMTVGGSVFTGLTVEVVE